MDPITHAFLGSAIGQAISPKRINNKLAVIGGLAAMAPDLDVITLVSPNPILFMIYHRHFTHSLLFIPLGAATLTLFSLMIFKSLRKEWPWILLVCFLAYGSHGLLDACTSYGTLLLWPFSDQRISWDIIAIVDPIFTLILALGIFCTYKLKCKLPVFIALFLAIGYLAFGYHQHSQALYTQKQLAKERQQQITQGRVMPELATLFHYRSVYISNDQIYLDMIAVPIYSVPQITTVSVKPLFLINKQISDILSNQRLNDLKIFSWFSDGYVTLAQQDPLTIVDLRFFQKRTALNALWGIVIPQDQDHYVIWRRNISI